MRDSLFFSIKVKYFEITLLLSWDGRLFLWGIELIIDFSREKSGFVSFCGRLMGIKRGNKEKKGN